MKKALTGVMQQSQSATRFFLPSCNYLESNAIVNTFYKIPAITIMLLTNDFKDINHAQQKKLFSISWFTY